MKATVETCRSCPARVIWCQTERGKAMPVDADPVVGGNLALKPARAGQQPLAVVVPPAKRAEHEALHVSHFKTCPHAGAWRKRRAS